METQFAEGTLAVQVIVLVQPPVSLEDAPLRETLKAVLAAPVARRVLALGGPGEDWLPAGFDLMAQRGADYGERMAGGLPHGAAPHAADPGGRPGDQRGHPRGRRAVTDLSRGRHRLRPGL